MDGTEQAQVERAETLGRLDALGVRESVLREAVQTGHEDAARCTGHDPVSLPGFLAWARSTRALRDKLVPQGWSAARSKRNYETIVDPKEGFAIAVAGGNAATGRRDMALSTRTEKGPATTEAIKENVQLSFAATNPEFGQRSPQGGGRRTWLLLHYHDKEGEEIRVELSLPSAISEGYVTAWRERLILSPIPVTKPVDLADEEADEKADEEHVDIQIERKAD